MNTSGIISGCVVRVEDRSRSFRAAIVTIAGETYREGRALVFFEQVRVTGSVAERALQLTPGQAVVFDQAHLEQLRWTDSVTRDPRAMIVIRAQAFARIGAARTRKVGQETILEGAMNAFTLKVRLAREVTQRQTPHGMVTEAVVVTDIGEGENASAHYFKVEGWREIGAQFGPELTRTGRKGVFEVMVKTEKNTIAGEVRHFTLLEARSASVFA